MLCFAKEVYDLEGVLGVEGELAYSKVKQGPEFKFLHHIKSWMWGHALTIMVATEGKFQVTKERDPA